MYHFNTPETKRFSVGTVPFILILFCAQVFCMWFSLDMAMAQSQDRLNQLLDVGSLKKLWGEGKFTEGPVWHLDGYVLFSDIPANRINRWDEKAGYIVFREPSQSSNGLTFDRTGQLIACEGGAHRVTRTLADGSIAVIADQFEGKRLNSPNDVVVSKKGIIYFTDPPFGVADGDRELDFQGVFAVQPDGKLTLFYRGMNRPNGLALSPDESVLYVDDTEEKLVNAFALKEDGSATGQPTVFGRLDGWGADGMKVDTQGNVYVTGPNGLYIWDKQGGWVGRLEVPEIPSNCAFGGTDGKTLFITARASLYSVQTKISGIHPGGWK